MQNVYFLGATDRFNYGDLLFPHIVDYYIKSLDEKNEIKVENYATIESNLENIGAKKTKSFGDLVADTKITNNVSIIVVGGEVLGAGWLVIYSFLYSIFKLIRKKDWYNTNRYLRRFLNYSFFPVRYSKYPFTLTKKDFPSVKNIIYNSVGGSVSCQLQDDFIDSSAFLSLRTKNDVAGFKKNDNIKLLPDSAILMSNIWTKSILEAKIKFAKRNPYKEYIFFQINKEEGLLHKDTICDKLENLHQKTNLPIVLCPIGLALGHEDQVALSAIAKQMQIPHFYCKEPNIWDVMYLISESKLFLGTSLHGVITAMSFSVPYLGIKRGNNKIQKYLSSWAIEDLSESVSVENMSDKACFVLNKDISNELKQSADRMKKMSLDGLKGIYDTIVR